MSFDSDYLDVTGLVSFDGINGATAATDDSSFANTVTFSGTAQLSNLEGMYGTTSLKLDGGASDFITMPDSDVWNLGKAGGTIEVSVTFSSVPGATQAIVSRWSGIGERSFVLRQTSTNLEFIVDTRTGFVTIAAVWTPTVDVLYDIEVDIGNVSESATSVTIRVDGVALVTQSLDKAINTVDLALKIGNDEVGDKPFHGFIGNFRFTRAVQRYTSNYTPLADLFPTSGDPDLLTETLTLINPGAEDGDMTGWTADVGSHFAFGPNASAAHSGDFMFHSSDGDALSRSYQDVSIPLVLHGPLDAGLATAFLVGFERDIQDDETSLSYEWFDAGASSLGARVDGRPISVDGGSWVFDRLQPIPPVGSRTLRLYIVGTRNTGINNDAYFDDLEVFFRYTMLPPTSRRIIIMTM